MHTDAGCHGHLSMFVALKVMKRLRAAKSNPFWSSIVLTVGSGTLQLSCSACLHLLGDSIYLDIDTLIHSQRQIKYDRNKASPMTSGSRTIQKPTLSIHTKLDNKTHSIINLEMPAGFHNEQTLATPSNHVLSLEPWTPNWWILPVLSVLSNVTGTRSVKRWMTWRRLCLNWMSSWHSWNTSVAPHGPERSDWRLWAYAGRTQSKHFRVWLKAPRKVLWWSRGHNDHSVFN